MFLLPAIILFSTFRTVSQNQIRLNRDTLSAAFFENPYNMPAQFRRILVDGRYLTVEKRAPDRVQNAGHHEIFRHFHAGLLRHLDDTVCQTVRTAEYAVIRFDMPEFLRFDQPGRKSGFTLVKKLRRANSRLCRRARRAAEHAVTRVSSPVICGFRDIGADPAEKDQQFFAAPFDHVARHLVAAGFKVDQDGASRRFSLRVEVNEPYGAEIFPGIQKRRPPVASSAVDHSADRRPEQLRQAGAFKKRRFFLRTAQQGKIDREQSVAEHFRPERGIGFAFMEGVLGKNHQNQPVRQVGNVGHLLIDEDSGSPHPADQPFCAKQFQGAVDCPVADLEMFRQFKL